ncbi:hypothetical protein [Capnocytophaga canimorsus]|uniref:hypothetical protein n=1 Tax=Capnocytophaga canimorsus TaxID=28188 RepID=UPI001ACFB563|nr:hypothetical protein [Capnocytophaga canimorsus]GIM59646.1 hypothetical protein CAPN007_18550 [Capnocytophaga canimorsus]
MKSEKVQKNILKKTLKSFVGKEKVFIFALAFESVRLESERKRNEKFIENIVDSTRIRFKELS